MRDTPIFVSIVGTQIMGTLEPLLALAASEGPLDIKLFYTVKTKEVAERLASFIQLEELGEVELSEIHMILGREDSAPQRIAAIAEAAQAQERRVCFNLDGGLNYLIAATVIALEKYQPLYIQVSRDRSV